MGSGLYVCDFQVFIFVRHLILYLRDLPTHNRYYNLRFLGAFLEMSNRVVGGKPNITYNTT